MNNQNHTKMCSNCKENKPVSEFYKEKGNKDGLRKQCKGCGKKSVEKNKERLFQEHIKFQLENPIYIKNCCICKKEKLISEFSKNKNCKDGLSVQCKSCAKQYNLENAERLLQEHIKFQIEHPIEYKICTYCKIIKHISEFSKRKSSKDAFNFRCKTCVKQWNSEHREEHSLWWKQYYLEHKEEINLYKKQWNLENPEYNKQYNLENKEEILIGRRKNQNNRRKTDINHRILCNYRGRVWHAIKNNQKSGHTIELLMCSIPELKYYLEKKFRVGMTWKNYGSGSGKWNIDHIIPCSFFNMLDPVEQYMCFRWQNLQPLWWKDNREKSDKIISITPP